VSAPDAVKKGLAIASRLTSFVRFETSLQHSQAAMPMIRLCCLHGKMVQGHRTIPPLPLWPLSIQASHRHHMQPATCLQQLSAHPGPTTPHQEWQGQALRLMGVPLQHLYLHCLA
jgi:hypothetical protein